ncbi:hypothetical protein G4952_09295 [Blautia wexlerae]|uniref:BIG2 domain-containing protein n=1 Tax=Blautia wexlerae TaxID=418240 RepID=A0ABX2GQG6_9FIRM|nr:hypothetical protein [Blautia wexlerae]NSF74004.1 hypothetical protein [Blautia wexlerae]
MYATKLKKATYYKYIVKAYKLVDGKKVVTVTSDSVIKAMRKGNCKIWVYAQNGVYKVITVTVK